jgi:hypothetical protein
MTDQRKWYAGVDWASASHHVVLTDDEGQKVGGRVFKHGGEGLAAMTGRNAAATNRPAPSNTTIG